MITRIVLFVLASVLLAAHFLRAGQLVAVALCLAVPLLFLYRKQDSLVLLQVAAYAATLIWLETAYARIMERQASGQSWTTSAIIFSVVALFTLVSGLLLNSRVMRERYPAR